MTRDRDLTGLVLLFKTTGDVSRMARVHAASCPMVNTARGRGRYTTKAFPASQDAIDDLNERGYPVRFCKCCG